MQLAQGHKAVTFPVAGLTFAIILLNVWLHDVLVRLLLVFSLVMLLFILFFFRDPERQIPDSPGILAPADGKIIETTDSKGYSSIKIMMSLFDVHVTRMPIDGKILSIKRKSGSFFPMIPFYTKISRNNARQIILVEGNDHQMKITQISAFLARRCVCYHDIGTFVPRGSRLGIVRLGSEVDIHFPSNSYQVKVQVGQTVRAGETLIATYR